MSAPRIYMVGAVAVAISPLLLPLDSLPPDRRIVWPDLLFGSLPLALVGVLLALLHHLHRLASTGCRQVAWIWGAAGVIANSPLVQWFPNFYEAVLAVQAVAAATATAGFVWLTREIWKGGLAGRLLFALGTVLIALRFATMTSDAVDWIRDPRPGSLAEAFDALFGGALESAMTAIVLSAAAVLASRRSHHSQNGHE